MSAIAINGVLEVQCTTEGVDEEVFCDTVERISTLDAIQWDQPTERRNTGQLLHSPHKYSTGTDSEHWSFGSLPPAIFA